MTDEEKIIESAQVEEDLCALVREYRMYFLMNSKFKFVLKKVAKLNGWKKLEKEM